MAILDAYDGSLSYLTEAAEIISNAKTQFSQETPDEDPSIADEPLTYDRIAEGEYFLGEYPFESLKESILNQFSNYISTEDRTNYVEIFYEQLHASETLLQDEEEEHPDVVKEILSRILDQFNAFMFSLFRQRLTISIVDFENGSIDPGDLEAIIRILYEYFILDARKNFRNVISRDIASKLPQNLSDEEFYQKAEEMLPDYSPIIYAVGPQEFLRLSSAGDDMINLFENNKIVGNFLRRYSPRLFENEDYQVDILAHIAIVHAVKGDFLDASKQ